VHLVPHFSFLTG